MAELSAELVQQPTGPALQTVFASQLGFGDLEAGVASTGAAADREYNSNSALWDDVLEERIRVGRVVHLEEFVLSEWFPLTPGQFHRPGARSEREMAHSEVLGRSDVGGQALAELERDLGRRIPRKLLDRATRDMVRVYSPKGKGEMLAGGIGCVRLKRKRLNSEDVWFMSASSSRSAHEGFPVAVPEALYQRHVDELAEAGGLTCRLNGKLHAIPDDWDPLFRRVVGMPRVYLMVDEVLTQPDQGEEPFLATGAVTFEAEWGAAPAEGVPEYAPAHRLHGAYVTFAPSTPGSVRDAVEWLGDTYVDGLFHGRVVTDFDEQVPRFSDATFGLERVTGRTLDVNAATRIIEECKPLPDIRELFIQQATRLSAAGRDSS